MRRFRPDGILIFPTMIRLLGECPIYPKFVGTPLAATGPSGVLTDSAVAASGDPTSKTQIHLPIGLSLRKSATAGR